MSKKLSRRKKAQRAKKRRMTFRISVEAQPVVVHYQPNRLGDMGHFEFRSPHRPPRRIPLSKSGYLSHYAAMEDVKAAKTPQEFAREEALALLRSSRRAWDVTNELPLF
jgi:hypothetical protein